MDSSLSRHMMNASKAAFISVLFFGLDPTYFFFRNLLNSCYLLTLLLEYQFIYFFLQIIFYLSFSLLVNSLDDRHSTIQLH